MQGHLGKEHLEAELTTVCGHCGARLEMRITSDLKIDVHTRGADPLVFEPDVEWARFRGPNILDAY